MSRCVVGMVTCSSKAEARKLAAAVLTPRLAACVNIVDDVESHYWWQGKLEKSIISFYANHRDCGWATDDAGASAVHSLLSNLRQFQMQHAEGGALGLGAHTLHGGLGPGGGWGPDLGSPAGGGAAAAPKAAAGGGAGASDGKAVSRRLQAELMQLMVRRRRGRRAQ